MDACLEDLQWILKQGLHAHKSLRVDDAISGDCMERPGFVALMNDSSSDRSISHIFVYRRDRLARPEDAMAMTSLERRVRKRASRS